MSLKCPRGKPRGHIYQWVEGEFYFKKRFAFHFKLSRKRKHFKRASAFHAKPQLRNPFHAAGISRWRSHHFKKRFAFHFKLSRKRISSVSKLQIALKECYESEYWLSLFSRTDIISDEIYTKLKNDCGKIRKLLIASINTTKERYNL